MFVEPATVIGNIAPTAGVNGRLTVCEPPGLECGAPGQLAPTRRSFRERCSEQRAQDPQCKAAWSAEKVERCAFPGFCQSVQIRPGHCGPAVSDL